MAATGAVSSVRGREKDKPLPTAEVMMNGLD
jgi:hypothetical protein